AEEMPPRDRTILVAPEFGHEFLARDEVLPVRHVRSPSWSIILEDERRAIAPARPSRFPRFEIALSRFGLTRGEDEELAQIRVPDQIFCMLSEEDAIDDRHRTARVAAGQGELSRPEARDRGLSRHDPVARAADDDGAARAIQPGRAALDRAHGALEEVRLADEIRDIAVLRPVVEIAR